MKTYPLTQTQFGMYLSWAEDHASTQYAVPVGFRLPRTVDPDRLERAIRTFVDANPVFRTRFVEEDGEYRQVSDPSIEIPYVRRTVSVAEAEGVFAAYPHPYDYLKGPLFRVEILETPEDIRLILDWAHVIVDGSSAALFFSALSALNDGKDGLAAVGEQHLDIFSYAESERLSF